MGVVHVSARALLFTLVWIALCRSSIGQYCGQPGKPAFSEFDPSDFYEVGDKVSYKCIDGYLLNSPFRNVTDFATFGQRECLPNGTWSHENVHCYHKNISGLSVYSCWKSFDIAQSFNTSSALFRFPLDKNSSECHPLSDQKVSVTTSALDRIFIVPYARNGLCGTPETPANGKLIRVNATTVRYVCNSGYQLEGNEYRYCVDSFWYGNQVICNKTTDENESDQSHIIATVAIALSALAVLSVFVTVFMIKRILKQRTHSNTDAHTSTMKKAKTVDTPIDTVPVYDEVQDYGVRASDHIYELPIQCSVTRPLYASRAN